MENTQNSFIEVIPLASIDSITSLKVGKPLCNLPYDWLSTAWAYPELETENGLWCWSELERSQDDTIFEYILEQISPENTFNKSPHELYFVIWLINDSNGSVDERVLRQQTRCYGWECTFLKCGRNIRLFTRWPADFKQPGRHLDTHGGAYPRWF